MDQEIIKAILTPEVVGTVFTGIVGMFTWMTSSVFSWVKSKTKDEKAQIAIQTIDNIVINTVKHIEQTTKKDLLKIAEDGKLTQDEKKQLVGSVKVSCVEGVKEEVWTEASRLIPDVGNYLEKKIESVVLDIKTKI